MTETHQLVSGADPEVALYDGISFYESGEIYNALTCWKELLRLVPEHEVAQRYVEFVQGYLGLTDQFSEQDVNSAQRRESQKLRGDEAPVAHSTGGFDPDMVSNVAQAPTPKAPEAPPPPESIRVRRGGASATSTHLAAGLIIDAEDNAEDLIEEEVITKKPDEALPVTLLATPVEQMALSSTAQNAVNGESGPRTQADGLTIQALSRQLADFHRSGKYEEAVDTAKKLLLQDPQHAVARRYIDEYHRQKQAALQAALRKQKAAQKVETKVQKSSNINQTQLGNPNVISAEVSPEDAPTAAPSNISSTMDSDESTGIQDFSHRPHVKMKSDQISWQAFDHRAGFFMSQVDGNTSYEDLIVISAMPREQALAILNQLVNNGVIG